MADPVLRIENLHKKFDDLEVLRGVDLEVGVGDVVSIIGSSGSGKSTFLRCINLLEIPDSGVIEVDGERIEMRQLKDGRSVPADPRQVDRIRTRVGMVFQNFNLWAHMTVLENVIEAPVHVLKMPKKQAIEKAEALLDKVGIGEKCDHYPSQLSGGQQQRCAIARTLAMDPKLLLFDEATSALDPELVGEVLKVIRDLADEGRTMIMVTHEMGFAREVSDEIIFLHQGKIEEQGPPSQVFGNPKSERCRQFLASTL